MMTILRRGERGRWQFPQLSLLVFSVLFGTSGARAQVESKAPDQFIVVLEGEPAAESFLKAKTAKSVSGAQIAARAQSAGLAAQHDAFSAQLKALGAKDWYVLLRHVVPNTFASVTVIATFGMAIVIITEASLSFLGLGVPVHIPTWGSMLSEGRSYINRAPWLTIFPGLAIFITVFGINLLGDGLRDILDPKLRRQR